MEYIYLMRAWAPKQYPTQHPSEIHFTQWDPHRFHDPPAIDKSAARVCLKRPPRYGTEFKESCRRRESFAAREERREYEEIKTCGNCSCRFMVSKSMMVRESEAFCGKDCYWSAVLDVMGTRMMSAASRARLWERMAEGGGEVRASAVTPTKKAGGSMVGFACARQQRNVWSDAEHALFLYETTLH